VTRGALRAAFLAALIAPSVRAAEPRPLTVEWISSPEADQITRLPRFAWTADGEILLLDERRPAAERTFERLDPKSGKRRIVVDRAAAISSLAALMAKDQVPESLAWPASLDRAGRKALYELGGDVFLLDLERSRFERLTRTDARESNARLSPDGRFVAFVLDNDLYALDLATRTERRLTSDGSATVLNGKLSYIYWEEIFHHFDDGFWWSDDSQAIAFLRSDDSAVDVATFTSFRPAVPEVFTQRYPRVGRTNPSVRLGVVDVPTGHTVWMQSPDPGYEYILGVTWLPDSRAVAAQTTNRAQDRLDILVLDRMEGTTRLLLTERDPAWVNQKEISFFASGREVLVSSERDGHTHLYRFRADGTLLNAVTRGDWSVHGPGAFYAAPMGSAFVDDARGWVYFTSLEKSPIERQLYRVRLDGSGMKRVSREDGVHRISFSPDRRFYLDAHSSHSTPPSLSLHDADGTLRAVLAPPLAEVLAPFDLPTVELRTVPASDGYPLQARIVKPRDFDLAARHPVILRVYGGTGVPLVRDDWDRAVLFDQLLAERGYVVASIDNRTATAASKTIENASLKDLWGASALNDLLDGVRWLKAQPWVDPERVGIWGRSGGGYFTLAAMTKSAEFRAGISVAPVTDWRYYDSKATEAYMKTPAENPDGYEATNLVARAKDLHGRLLIVFGTYDDNVHPQNSLAFMDALVGAGKLFDVMAYPMRKHGIDDRAARAHLYAKMLEFWKTYL
jgi:dipeptidyl-peptidase 4